VAPTRTVGTSASIIFPCSIKIQKTGGGETSLNAAQPYAKAEGRVFLLVLAYPGFPGTKAVKRLLLFTTDVHGPKDSGLARPHVANGGPAGSLNIIRTNHDCLCTAKLA